MNKSNYKFRLALPVSALVFMAACASKPEGYTALPAGSDISAQMDQTESALAEARQANVALLAPRAFKKANKAFKEAKEDRAGNESNEEILKDLSLAQAHLRLAQRTAQVSGPALATVMNARNGAIDAEADRVLAKKLKDIDEDVQDAAIEIEKNGDLNEAREDGPKLIEKYAKLRTEALEKGGRSMEQRALRQENTDLRAANSAAAQAMIAQGAKNQKLTNKIGAQAGQEAKLNAVRAKFSREEADVLVNRDNEIVIRLKGLQFPSNRADIPSASLPLLSKLEQALAEFPESKITVEGHTDSLGSAEVNKSLSLKRAEAVTGYLNQSQTDAKREIEALGMGLDEPVASNKSAAGRAQNRRIDVVVSPSTEAAM